MNERQSHEERLAVWADRTLKQLPARPAPATLAPRILAQIARQSNLAWYQKPWMNWPRHFQLLSALLFAGVIGGIYGFLLPALGSVQPPVNTSEWVEPVSTTVSILGVLGNAAAAVLKNTQGWVLATGLGILACLYLSCIGLGTACWRIVSNTR